MCLGFLLLFCFVFFLTCITLSWCSLSSFLGCLPSPTRTLKLFVLMQKSSGSSLWQIFTVDCVMDTKIHWGPSLMMSRGEQGPQSSGGWWLLAKGGSAGLPPSQPWLELQVVASSKDQTPHLPASCTWTACWTVLLKCCSPAMIRCTYWIITFEFYCFIFLT